MAASICARAGRPPSDYFGLLEAILRFDFTADYHAITIPALLTANDGDTFFGRQPYEAFSLLTSVPAASPSSRPPSSRALRGEVADI